MELKDYIELAEYQMFELHDTSKAVGNLVTACSLMAVEIACLKESLRKAESTAVQAANTASCLANGIKPD